MDIPNVPQQSEAVLQYDAASQYESRVIGFKERLISDIARLEERLNGLKEILAQIEANPIAAALIERIAHSRGL